MYSQINSDVSSDPSRSYGSYGSLRFEISCLIISVITHSELLKECQKRAKEWEKAVELAEKAASMERENLETSLKNMENVMSEKDGLIEFLTFEAEEKKRQVDDIAKTLSKEQKFVDKSIVYSLITLPAHIRT